MEQTSVEKNINRKISLRNLPFGGFFSNWNRQLSLEKKSYRNEGRNDFYIDQGILLRTEHVWKKI